jgi:hypothetical protein
MRFFKDIKGSPFFLAWWRRGRRSSGPGAFAAGVGEMKALAVRKRRTNSNVQNQLVVV